MPRSYVPLTNFTSGQFDPKLYGRSDIEQYKNGAKTLENIVVEWYGGATRTPGTYYVNEVKDSSKETRLIPFIFSNIDTYMLEFGDLYIRFYRNHGQITDGISAYEVVTTYTESELFDITYVQTADVIYLFHPSHPPAQLVRFFNNYWVLSDVAFEKGPKLDANTDTTLTITPSGDTGSGITLTASSDLFVAGHEGSIWKINEGYVLINSVDSPVLVDDADVLYDGDLNTGPGATYVWAEGAFSDYRGYPRAGAFYEDRLCMIATNYQPNTIFISEPGAYEQFEGGADDDDAIIDTINASRLNIFRWVDSGEVITLANEGGLVKYWSGSDSQPLTPSNKNARKIAEEGSSSVQPVNIGNEPYYVGRDGKIIRTKQYNLQSDNYSGADVSLLSRSLISDSVTQMAYQQAPHSTIWYVLSDGSLVTSTINIGQKITAFTTQADTGSYKSVAVIPTTGYDEVWFIVERTVNGSTVKYIEYLMPFDVSDQEDQFFVRSGLTYDSTSTTTITGLTHLEGESVAILADGYVQSNKTVSGGSITLDRAASKVHIGLPYTSIIETLDLNTGAAIGSAIGKHRHIIDILLELYKTGAGVKVGTSTTQHSLQFTQPASLYTGRKSLTFPQGFNKEKTVYIIQSNPLPMTVNAIYPDMHTND